MTKQVEFTKQWGQYQPGDTETVATLGEGVCDALVNHGEFAVWHNETPQAASQGTTSKPKPKRTRKARKKTTPKPEQATT